MYDCLCLSIAHKGFATLDIIYDYTWRLSDEEIAKSTRFAAAKVNQPKMKLPQAADISTADRERIMRMNKSNDQGKFNYEENNMLLLKFLVY